MSALDTPTARVEATEIIIEEALEYGRDGSCELTLVIDGIPPDEWDEIQARHIAEGTKVVAAGPHTIEYRKGDDR